MTELDHAHTAVLVMDYQAEVLAGFGDKAKPLVERSASVIAAARAAKLPIIYVVVGFRPGYPELDPRSLMASVLTKTGRLQTTSPGSDIAPELRPHDGDLVVWKHRINAFAGTDLEIILRAKRIETLVLLGVATGGVVLSTVRHAFDADYRLVVVEDCCADGDDELHRVLMTKVFARQGSVASASEIAAALGR